jgi:oligopeptide transport system ATP-binding protein
MTMPLLEVSDLRVRYPTRYGRAGTHAVNGVSFAIEAGDSVALVGESGCGKTTVATAIVGLIHPSGGGVRFAGCDLRELRGPGRVAFRRAVQMVFQDPSGSLNPRLSIGSALAEPLAFHRVTRRRAATAARVAELLAAVGLDADYAARYPHELSGGQKQRVGLARALAVEPSLIVCDEPVSALDVSVQVQILNLLRTIRERTGIAYLIIVHDLAVARYLCDRVLVMYLGRLVEAGPSESFFARPAHPYSRALLSAVPTVAGGLRARQEGSRRIVLAGDVPSGAESIAGCPFHPRCSEVREICRVSNPSPQPVAACHTAACHFAGVAR